MSENIIGIVNNSEGNKRGEISLIPNEKTGKQRIEVTDLNGKLLAHQTVDGDIDTDTAALIGFALYNGWLFGYAEAIMQTRTKLERMIQEQYAKS